jgi:hypothetical protein
MMSRDDQNVNVNIGGRIEGVDLLSFLQMMNNAAKTCTLRVTTDEDIGYLHIESGELIASETADLRDIQAAYTIIGWDHVGIEIEELQTNKQRTIQQPMMSILLEGSRLKDEKNPIRFFFQIHPRK